MKGFLGRFTSRIIAEIPDGIRGRILEELLGTISLEDLSRNSDEIYVGIFEEILERNLGVCLKYFFE